MLLARPYHNDPGLNHEILEEFQKLGYPVLTLGCAADRRRDHLDGCSATKFDAGVITHPMDITDAWKNSYSENTSQKVWAAKYAARHPNLVALELSSFKCGHDAPIYTVVEETVDQVRHAVLLASRISTRTSPPARSGSASRPSATS